MWANLPIFLMGAKKILCRDIKITQCGYVILLFVVLKRLEQVHINQRKNFEFF